MTRIIAAELVNVRPAALGRHWVTVTPVIVGHCTVTDRIAEPTNITVFSEATVNQKPCNVMATAMRPERSLMQARCGGSMPVQTRTAGYVLVTVGRCAVLLGIAEASRCTARSSRCTTSRRSINGRFATADWAAPY
jgi:hypothetical protein